ncbi:hypothetical protein GIB67_019520 [Kingdonia uniflora]|uniref:K Homology domain-containing protein n=1 Tax=Kingdonia uniflora TaxID=39325 RepID=A0A7J7N0N4_9MAGN|nr:hypothetical protein GIB67_019520 [Kingdonia uniflora]
MGVEGNGEEETQQVTTTTTTATTTTTPELESIGVGGGKRKLDDIQIAKQKAQEMIARIVNDADSKRPRLDDPTSPSSDQYPPPTSDAGQKPSIQLTDNSEAGSGTYNAQSGSYYGFQSTSKRIEIPNGKVGVIIGRGGENIKYIQTQSGAKVQIIKDADVDPYSQTRDVELTGTSDQISIAEQLIKDVMAKADAQGSGPSAPNVPHGSEQFIMKVPNEKVALIIGKGGESIKNMQSRSGARIQIIPLHLPPGDTSTERTAYINGSPDQIESAKALLNEVISGNRPRNPTGPNNYMQQSYRPPANWAQPPVQQPGYGYQQSGTYPTPAPVPAPAPSYYGNYPQQQSGWDHSNSSAPTQAPQQNTEYNYYRQQGQNETGTAQTNINYGYGQPPPVGNNNYNQGYSQQPQNYGQDAPSQGPQYDQQKPYMSVPPSGSQLDGMTPSQTYGSQPTTQTPPAYSATYNQPQTVPLSGYGNSQGYMGPPQSAQVPPQQGYEQTVYSQSAQVPPQQGYDQTAYSQSAQAPPPTSQQPVYGGDWYPQQVAPAQSSYVQGTTAPAYGQQ